MPPTTRVTEYGKMFRMLENGRTAQNNQTTVKIKWKNWAGVR